MITSRFNKDEVVDQREYMTSKLRKKRTVTFLAISLAMVSLFIVLALVATPFRTAPFFMPLFPPILSLLILVAGLLGAGMYFRKRMWTVADSSARRPMMLRSGRWTAVFMVISIMVLVFFLPMSPLFPNPNYAESVLEKTGHPQIGPSTHIRLEFQGAGNFAAVRSSVSIDCINNLSLDFYLLTKTDADQLDTELSQLTDMALASRICATGFEYGKLDLDSQPYTVVIVNANDDTADMSYSIQGTTSGEITSTLVMFTLVYIVIEAVWMTYTRKLAAMPELPVALPPALVQTAPQPERPTVQRAPMGAATASGLASESSPTPMAAGSEPQAGGTRMAITCPRCSTTFDVVRGAGRTRIKCPSCGKEGTLAGLPMPPPEPQPEAPPVPEPATTEAPYIPRVERPAPRTPPAPSYIAAAPRQPAYPVAQEEFPGPAAPEPPAEPAYPPSAPPEIPEAPALPAEPVTPVMAVPRRNIACPRCKQIFSIDKVEGPQQIRCPHCGKEGTIGGRRPPAAAPPAPRPSPAPIPEAPVTHIPVSPAVSPKMICCPACKSPFPVAETRRPLQVRCPNCGKEGVLRK